MKWSPQQASALDAIGEWQKGGDNQVFRLFGYAGTGKAQPLTAQIQTPSGVKRMMDMKVGDIVFGANGKRTEVIGVFPQGECDVYCVTFRDNTTVECSGDHLWQVNGPNREKRGLRPLVRTTIELMTDLTYPSGNKKWKIPLCDPVLYETEHPPVDPYTIGVLIANGWLSGNVVDFACNSQDLEIVDRIDDALPDGMIMSKYDHGGCYHFHIKDMSDVHWNRLKQHLEICGLRVHSKFKRIPQLYLQAPLEDRVDLLHGLMDTDGSILNNRTSYSTSSSGLADDIMMLVQSLGGTAIIHKYERKDRLAAEYQINVKTPINPFSLKRKANAWLPSDKNPPSRYIWNIELIGKVQQQCIKVAANDGLYLTDNFIVTHNTTLVKHIAEGCGKGVVFAAYTGKAALVMRKMGCAGAGTIHSLIYTPLSKLREEAKALRIWINSSELDKNDEELAMIAAHRWGTCKIPALKRKLDELRTAIEAGPSWILKENLKSGGDEPELIIIDECSMVSEDVGEDLLSFGVKVLVIGDPGQLPPVRGQGFFVSGEPDVLLTEVHRQALDNPIVRMATTVRTDGAAALRLGQYGASAYVLADGTEAVLGCIADADQVLAGMHVTRRHYNERIRASWGFSGAVPMAGEKLICGRNNKEDGLLNGSLWEVISCSQMKNADYLCAKIKSLDSDDVKLDWIRMHSAPFAGKEIHAEDRFDYNEFDFGYVLTVHKAQGSQWPHVALINDGFGHWDKSLYNRWFYTGVTRAIERVTIVRPGKRRRG